jgi:hypothetical protein
VELLPDDCPGKERFHLPEAVFFADSPPGFTEQTRSVVAAGCAAGEDPQEAVRAALAMHAYEIAFRDSLADGLG